MCKYLLRIAIVAIGTIAMLPRPALAMHISEGILPAGWAGLWFAVAVPFVAFGLHVIKTRRARHGRYMAMLAMVGAAVFLISCMPIPVPVAGSCSHPCGTGLAAILVGPAATVVIASIALVFQALFMAHGGLTTLGANIVSMGIVGAFAGYAAYRVVRRLSGSAVLGAFAAGLVSDWATYAATSLVLSSAIHGDGSLWTMFWAILVAFVPTQLPLGILEGLLSAGAYRFVMARRPELFEPAPISLEEV
jgi:cobalt/nickel transport system permease protein